MKVAALTKGRNVPSSKYRIRQCLPALGRIGVDVTEYCPLIPQVVRLPWRLRHLRRRYFLPIILGQVISNLITRIPGTINSHRADLVWISRSFLPGMNRFVHLTGKPRVLDIDDAIWLTEPLGPAQAARNARRMDAVIVGNTYLANWYEPHCHKLEIIPTSVDCEIFRPLEVDSDCHSFTIGWVGTSVNYCYLRDVFSVIKCFLDDHKDSRFMVISDRRPDWWPGDSSQYFFNSWRADQEVQNLNMLDVGLMPLRDSDWAKGKCSFKMLQYMAVGKPVIVSPVGMNNEILELGACGLGPSCVADWYSALETLHGKSTAREAMGITGRAIAMEHFSTQVVVGKYASVFKDVIC